MPVRYYLRKPLNNLYNKNDKTDLNNDRHRFIKFSIKTVCTYRACNRVYKVCKKYKVFTKFQNGFQKKRSTVLAAYEYIQEAYEITKNTQSVYC